MSFLYEVNYTCTYCGADYDCEQDTFICHSCDSARCPNCKTTFICSDCGIGCCNDCSIDGDICDKCLGVTEE